MQSALEENSTDLISHGGVFFRLLLAGILGIVIFSFANVTYNLPTLIETLPIDRSELPPNIVLILAATIQPAILVALAIWTGLALSKRMGVNVTPILTSTTWQKSIPLLFAALVTGVVAGLIMLAVHQLIFLPTTGVPVNTIASLPFWLAMASALLYGGIVEELLLRLGLMTFLLWLGTKVQSSGESQPKVKIFWLVNLIVTIIFGLLHLVPTPLLMGITITPAVVVQALVLNSVGLIFGWFYWHKGIETAITAHMGVHLGYTLMAILFL